MVLQVSSLIWVVVFVSMLSASTLSAQLPTEGLVLHLDAAQIAQADIGAGGKASRWQDLSPGENHVEQVDTDRQPVVITGVVNDLPALRFSGNQYLDGPAVLAEGDASFTIAAVWKREDTAAAQAICEQAAGGEGRRASLLTVGDRYGFNGQNNDQHSLIPYQAGALNLSVLTLDDSGMVRVWHNDSRGGTGRRGQIDRTLQNTGCDRFRVAAKATTGGECLRGELAEILVYDRVLTPVEIEALNKLLGAKWDLGKPDEDGNRSVTTMPQEEMDKGPDYTSIVPAFTFAETLPQQEAQLRDNPLLERFARSRRSFAADPYRPAYHFVSPESSLNDPNGLCFWQGRWHLFYQGYPPEDPRQHWGHAVSDDLIHWRDLPYAIYPHPERCCFSGSTLVEDDRVIAMYHGTEVGNMVAVSSDPLLLNWEKVTGQAVIPQRNADGSVPPYNVFDPCIWKQGGLYYSLSAGTLPGPGGKRLRANYLLRSADLANWEYLHPFVEEDHYSLVGDDGACPYFWPIGDKHILLHFSHMSGGKYLLGDYDTERDKFVVTGGGDFNFGPYGPAGVHAPSAAPDDKGGVIAIFNMNPAKPTPGWNQIMSLPRRLSLAGPDDLRVEPAGDIESLRSDGEKVGQTALPANQEVVLEGVGGNVHQLIAEIDPQGAPMVELNVLRSPGREELTRIAFYPQRGYHHRSRDGRPGNDGLITIDTSYSSVLSDVLSRAPETAPVYLPEGEPVKLRVFIDRSVVEVFVNGRQCVAVRVYPGREDSLGVSLRSQGRDAVLRSLEAWQLNSIYGEN